MKILSVKSSSGTRHLIPICRIHDILETMDGHAVISWAKYGILITEETFANIMVRLEECIL